MKKLIGMLLATTIVLGGFGVKGADAKVINKGNKSYITLDKTEMQENKMVLKEVFKIKKFKVATSKKCYTVKYKSHKGSSSTKKQVKRIAKKLHGVNIEKSCSEYRNYKVKVIGIDKQGHKHIKVINGHKVK